MSEPTPVISLRGVGKTYRTGAVDVRALDGIDLDIMPGEFLTITGPSGSGKSTLLHILGCLDHVSEGSFDLAGNDVANSDDDALSAIRNRYLGFVFQKYNLLSNLTVLENIALPLAYSGIPKSERQAIAKRKAEEVGLGDRLHHTPSELSGGQAQRVAIARALVHEPDILFADEPTGALDSRTGQEILELIKSLNRSGKTIVMVTHDAEIARAGTRNIRIRDGLIEGDERIGARSEVTEMRPRPESGNKGLAFLDLLRIGLKEGLLAHKTRTALTMLGVVIGTASVIAMSSFSEGSQKKQADQIRALGSNLIRVVDKQLVQDALREARVQGSEGLSIHVAEEMRLAVPHIEAMALVRKLDADVYHGKQRLQPRIIGVSGDYLPVNNLSLAEGGAFTQQQLDLGLPVAILGAGIARDMETTSVLGSELIVGGQVFRVIGVLADRNVDLGELEASAANDANLDLLLPLNAVLNRTRYLHLRSELDEVQLQISREDLLVSVGRHIRRFLSVKHRGVEDFGMVIPMDLLKTRQESQKLMRVLSIIISTISLIVGGIGIMNIMLASVTERLREIGIRRSVGATRRDIRRQFLIESTLISSAGGLVGVLAAVGVVVASSMALALPIVFVPIMLIISVGAALATGLCFGFYPAAQAANQNLVEVLQNE